MRADIPAVTGLRFVAASAVFVSHALPKIIPLPNGYSGSGLYQILASVSAEGMSLFFVLSGFVIHYNYSEQIQHQGGRGLFNFFIARFARLYPLYLFCITFELLLKYSYSQVPGSLAQALPYYLTLTYSWFYIPLGSNALIYQFGLISSVAWSISTEWFFYCAYPLICLGLSRLPRIRNTLYVAAAVCLVSVCFIIAIGEFSVPINGYAVERFGDVADMESHWQDSFFRWLVYFSPYSRLFEFLLGCLCASIYMKRQNQAVTRHEERWGMVVLLIALVVTVTLHVFWFAPSLLHMPEKVSAILSPLRWLNMAFGLAPSMAVIIFCCARYKSTLTRWLSAKPIIQCGEASYSMYLLHLLVIFAFRWEAAPVTSFRVLIGDALRLGLTYLSVIGLSLVVWSLVEVPTRRWLRKFMIPESAAVLAIQPLR